ncbi:NCS2 family permease [Pseudenhygromyxa sp. WMMC2535]|uniref:NCS2 family permease n=1 Tax=Pseudenhygromyxa sp. WMMC2535 TaxID=2712867 RepID=UPI001551F42D|nr:NCS2 family permease [Pseudenhygromyxa sp. WMMC2535]NVB38602.1 NCS2 family permease [Pseudenhygromyxa sp. WMMC2535]
MRPFVRGDVDGFFGLALDNLVQLLLIDALCRSPYVLGFSDELVRGTILPGAAVSMVVGNIFYARQALELAKQTGREDICALPYGINTVSLFAHVFLVMLPAKLAAEAAGVDDPSRVAWQAGLLACLGSGIIELGGAFVAEKLRRITPRAALLSTLAGIALGFISLGFLFRTFAHPIVGLSTLGIVLLTYFGRVKFKGRLPGGFVAVALGTALAWIIGLAPAGEAPTGSVGLMLPVPVIGDVLAALSEPGMLAAYFAVIVPMGLFNVVGSLQNIESAEAAGDSFPVVPSLAVNGAGSIVAALFGSCFPTTIYIGHPGWKAMGARAGYSVANAVFVTLICLSGTLAWITWAVPVDAGMAIVLWIGVVITAQAFQVTPKPHAPAVVIGILPGVAAWGAGMAKNGLRAAGLGNPTAPFGEGLVASFQANDLWIDGAFALEQGFIFTAMILATVTVLIIERKFTIAGLWLLAAAALSSVGLMHGYRWTVGDTVLEVFSPWHHPERLSWTLGYLAMAAVLFLAPTVTVPDDVDHSA